MVLLLIFSLLLQFYLQKQVLTAQQLKIEKERLTAELMVSLALKKDLKTSGQFNFDCGNLNYKLLTDLSVNSTSGDQAVSNKIYCFDIRFKDGMDFKIKR